MSDLWHAYGAVDGDEYFQMVIGPVDSEKVRGDKQSWDSAYFGEGPYTNEPCIIDHIASFDHEPTLEERTHLVPEEHRESFVRRALNDETLEDPEAVIELDLDSREQAALSLAIETRIVTLSHLHDRLVVEGHSTRAAIAAKEQIQALLTLWDKFKLEQTAWEF
jgi:hypothetical protein